jgi:hypothetical protein
MIFLHNISVGCQIQQVTLPRYLIPRSRHIVSMHSSVALSPTILATNARASAVHDRQLTPDQVELPKTTPSLSGQGEISTDVAKPVNDAVEWKPYAKFD